MMLNGSLSIPNALKRERPRTTTRTRRPSNGRMARRPAVPIWTGVDSAAAFEAGGHVAGQGVRSLPRGGGLARPLSRLHRRAPAAGDVEAARAAVLARPERPPPDGRGNPDSVAPARSTATGTSPATGDTCSSVGSWSGARRSIASRPRASAPSRRSTRRSPGLSRSWARVSGRRQKLQDYRER